MEQKAQVIRIVNEQTAMIAVTRQSACSGDCHTCHGCPHPEEVVVVSAENPLGAKAGDDVIVESSTKHVLKLAVMLYIMPLLLFFVGYFLMSGSEGLRIAVGGIGFVIGIGICVWVSRNMKKSQKEMQFCISSIVGSHS